MSLATRRRSSPSADQAYMTESISTGAARTSHSGGLPSLPRWYLQGEHGAIRKGWGGVGGLSRRAEGREQGGERMARFAPPTTDSKCLPQNKEVASHASPGPCHSLLLPAPAACTPTRLCGNRAKGVREIMAPFFPSLACTSLGLAPNTRSALSAVTISRSSCSAVPWVVGVG